MSDDIPVVKEPEVTTPAASEGVIPQSVPPPAPEDASGSEPPKPGEQTPRHMLLESLQQERDKVKRLEEELENLKSSALPEEGEPQSEEGRLLADKISKLESSLEELRAENAKKDVLLQYPVLKDQWNALEEFRADPENKGMNLRTAAKAFLIEHGLLEQTARKGLEKTTGGTRTAPTLGTMTPEEVQQLRETNWRKYREMLEKDQIKIK